MSDSIPSSLTSAIENIYRPAGMAVTEQPQRETENDEWEGCTLELDDRSITFRTAKITPERPGSFVAIYDRIGEAIVPVDTNSREIDFLVVEVSDQNAENRGQFVFSKAILLNKGILSIGLSRPERLQRKKGKLSFRVFPPWVQPKRTALKTQEWQRNFFFRIPTGTNPDFALVRRLFKKV